MIWILNVVCGALEPQPWPYIIAWTLPCPQFSNTISLWLRHSHKFFKENQPPRAQAKQCKGATMSPSTAYQGFKTLWMCMIWMWDAVCGVLEPQPWSYNITWTSPWTQYSKIKKQPVHVEQCKGAPICPSTAYQGAKTLCIYMILMWDAVCGALEFQPWPYNITELCHAQNFNKSPPPAQVEQYKGAPMSPSTAY